MTNAEFTRLEQTAARYGERAIEFIRAAEWTREYPTVAACYANDAKTAASIAAGMAFAAHPEWRD